MATKEIIFLFNLCRAHAAKKLYSLITEMCNINL